MPETTLTPKEFTALKHDFFIDERIYRISSYIFGNYLNVFHSHNQMNFEINTAEISNDEFQRFLNSIEDHEIGMNGEINNIERSIDVALDWLKTDLKLIDYKEIKPGIFRINILPLTNRKIHTGHQFIDLVRRSIIDTKTKQAQQAYIETVNRYNAFWLKYKVLSLVLAALLGGLISYFLQFVFAYVSKL